jgi:hypothetical protein
MCVLGAWTDLEGGDELSGWIKGDPHPGTAPCGQVEPLRVSRKVAPGQLIELQMAEGQVTEEMGVHLLGVLSAGVSQRRIVTSECPKSS